MAHQAQDNARDLAQTVSHDVEKSQCVHEELKPDDLEGDTRSYATTAPKTSPAEIKLVRKLDWIILPTLWIMYWFNYLDRNAITVARLDGLEEELNLTSTQYQTSVAILFVGYILGQVPSNMLITRIRPSLFMASFMALWAVISTLTAIAKDFKGLLLTRFFLGVVEAPFYPGALYMLSMFYNRNEIATRISILFTANICGTAFAGLIAIGVFKMSGVAGLAGWRWLFILQGIITFIVSIVSVFILPDEPQNTRWLSQEERSLAASRIAEDTVRLKANTNTWAGLVEALRDSNLWVLIFVQHLHLAASNFKNFFPTIVETLGFSRNVTLALTCPPYLVSGVISIAWAASSGHFNERVWHITASKCVAVLGFVLACTTLNIGARYFAMCTFATGVYSANSIILGWVSTTCGQTREKKAISLAIVNTFASISAIYGPYLWPKSNAPRYTIPMLASAAFSIGAVFLAWLLRWMLVRANKKLLQQSGDSRPNLYPY
ncbi:MFS domain-containing protein [Fusarium falciforme]|uniref:MFS domain-containing protein n=1 Tax=Fusarium falciforme TaxID=195108 RepID=UPI0023002075|nr:MFS domain-containing protein [Fusarium falciforme]WAO94601.1 MFS domain-containing protein [Fusarium falciforme]